MFEFRGLTARVSGALDNQHSNENKHLLNLPGKSMAAPNSMRKDPLKKAAFSDLKNQMQSNNQSTPIGNKSNAFASAMKLNKPLLVPQLKVPTATKQKVQRQPSLSDFVAELPLKPIDGERRWAEKWVPNDEQIERLLALRDRPVCPTPPPVPAQRFDMWECYVDEVEEDLAPLPLPDEMPLDPSSLPLPDEMPLDFSI